MNTDAKRYYALLGLAPSCSDEDIRSAFRRRAKELHPDAGSGDAAAFIRLKRAYDTLSDPDLRARYDRASNVRVRRSMRASSVPSQVRRIRPGRTRGMSLKRYFVAFVFMGGLSFGAIEAMISYADVPSSGSSHPISLLAGSPARETAKNDVAIGERAAASPGFWDPANPNGTPREAAEERERTRPRATGFGNSP